MIDLSAKVVLVTGERAGSGGDIPCCLWQRAGRWLRISARTMRRLRRWRVSLDRSGAIW